MTFREIDTKKISCHLVFALLITCAVVQAIEFKWDAFNRLVETNGIGYLYDSMDRRVAKTDIQTGEKLRVYIYNNWQMIAIYDGTGKLLFEFVDGPQYIDEHLLLINYKENPAGVRYYYLQDPTNYNVDKIFNEAGQVVETYEYTAYGETTVRDAGGNVIEWSNVGNPYGFQGRFYDTESHLYYFRYRMYSPEMKRFISMDPMGFADSMNLYETFGCDPVNNLDPFGLLDFMNAGILFAPHSVPTDYLDRDVGVEYYDVLERAPGKVVSVGSTTSGLGIAASFGINSWRDARNQGNIIAEKLSNSSDSSHRFVAHSQGCRIALEGIYRYAYYFKPERQITIRMVLSAPKIRESYLNKVIQKVQELAPNIDLQIMVIFNPEDWKVPLPSFPYWGSANYSSQMVNSPDVNQQVQVAYTSSIGPHAYKGLLGFLPITPGEKDAFLKEQINHYLNAKIAAFLAGNTEQIDRFCQLDLEKAGVFRYISTKYNFSMGN